MCQDFDGKMYFEDAVGNKDTIEFGIHSQGTDSIDINLGEINIINEERKEGLDVSIGNHWPLYYIGVPPSVRTKRQLVNNEDYIYGLTIRTENYPVTAKWDIMPYETRFRNSLITSVPPGGWFDVGSPSNLYFVKMDTTDESTFTTNCDSTRKAMGNYCIEENEERVGLYWLTLYADFTIGNKPNDEEQLRVIPNPSNGQMRIEGRGKMNVTARTVYGHVIRKATLIDSGTIIIEHKGIVLIEVETNLKRSIYKVIVN